MWKDSVLRNKTNRAKFKILNAYCARIILTLFSHIYIGVVINESKKAVDKLFTEGKKINIVNAERVV